ncbi:hypothetical protein DAPPUDRAFT_244721 [Daphnia pulex]|uniref:Peptidase S1 domain-containing protein n=1 Tax=Daphnia pulex TaxID=6669 RepID=E9GLM8_DAPPU|nr:hypothetical protein DAPPUDRAFT_244721 [Daphnia pulex]|eukprot:EFX79661.1 hypothetical protein DAPPUDRAFT_244721 [Daphnia pulex]
MARLQPLAVFSFAAVHLLLFSICPVSSRIYETNDAVIIEVTDIARAKDFGLSTTNFGFPGPIPMAYAVNPYMGLYYQQQQPNFPFWPYPLLKPASISLSAADVDKVTATSADSRQQNIACGVGPDAPPQRFFPDVSIVGGTEAVKNSWPFIVGLRRAGMNTIFCAGSIISQTRILTAAHCVEKLSALDILGLTVSLGMHTQGDGNTFQNDAQQTRRITRVVYHKNYNFETSVNDIAVLTMDPPISYSKAISPVCLPDFNTAADQFVDKDAAIIGWGRLNFGGQQPNALQQATVKITSKADCTTAWASIAKIFNQHICTGADGKDVCQGDSGGPLIVQPTEGSTAWTQVGITSFGLSCPAEANKPSVYANVALFRKWIDTYMKS